MNELLKPTYWRRWITPPMLIIIVGGIVLPILGVVAFNGYKLKLGQPAPEQLPYHPLLNGNNDPVVDAQSLGSIIDLGPHWKANSNDDPSFSNPKLDDSNWRPVGTPPSTDSQNWHDHDIIWYRYRLTIPPGLKSLGFSPYGLLGSYRIYVNGHELLGGIGSMENGGEPRIYLPRVFIIPDNIAPDGKMVIAIRSAVGAYKHNTGEALGGMTTMGDVDGDGLMLLGSVNSLTNYREVVIHRTFMNNYIAIGIDLVLALACAFLPFRLLSNTENRYRNIGLAFVCILLSNLIIPFKELYGWSESGPASWLLFILQIGYSYFYIHFTETILRNSELGSRGDNTESKNQLYRYAMWVLFFSTLLFAASIIADWLAQDRYKWNYALMYFVPLFKFVVDDTIAPIFLFQAARINNLRAAFLFVPAAWNLYIDAWIMVIPRVSHGYEFHPFPNPMGWDIGWDEVAPLATAVAVLLVVCFDFANAVSIQNAQKRED